MERERNGWGVPSFIAGLLLLGGILWLWRDVPVAVDPLRRDRILAVVGATGALLTAWFGHLSYPRVYNLKIMALAIGTATASLLGLAVTVALPFVVEMTGSAAVPAAGMVALLSVLIVLLTTTVAPEFVGYRTANRVSLILVAVLIGGTAAGLAIPAVRVALARALVDAGRPGSTVFWLISTGVAAIVTLSVFSETNTSGIGGIHTGAALFLGAAWLIPDADQLLRSLVLAALPLHVGIGTLIHWIVRLENRASYDPLLRIYNRGWADAVLEERSQVDLRAPATIAMVDIDHFKAVNDTHGHDGGDAVLQTVAARVRSAVLPDGIVARFGGEELIVFLPRFDQEAAEPILERVRAEVERTAVPHRRRKIQVTCSIGFATRAERSQPLELVLKAADKALYAAKEGGRNQVCRGRLRRKG